MSVRIPEVPAEFRVNKAWDEFSATDARGGTIDRKMCCVMVSAHHSGARGPGSNSVREHCVVFLGKTLNFHGASL